MTLLVPKNTIVILKLLLTCNCNFEPTSKFSWKIRFFLMLFFWCAPFGHLYFLFFRIWTRIGYISRHGIALSLFIQCWMRQDLNPWPFDCQFRSLPTRLDFLPATYFQVSYFTCPLFFFFGMVKDSKFALELFFCLFKINILTLHKSWKKTFTVEVQF